MRIGVTGATGFVGQALIPVLHAAGHDVVPIVRRSSGLSGEVVVGDLSASPAWPTDQRLDAIIHLAARAHVMKETAAFAEAAYQMANVNGTRGALDLARQSGARRFVSVSSIKANGEATEDGRAFNSASSPAPEDAYGRSKLAAEALVQASGLEWVIVRPPMIYGANAKGNFPLLVRLVRSGVPVPLGSVTNKRSMIYLGNLLSLLEQCAVHSRANGHVFLPSDGEDMSVQDLIRAIAKASGVAARLFHFPVPLLHLAGRLTGRADQVKRLTGSLRVDSTATAKELDWQPPFSVEQALSITLAANGPLNIAGR